MRTNELRTVQEAEELIDRYGSGDSWSNFYMRGQELGALAEGGLLSEWHSTGNLLLFVRKAVGMRVYFFMNDLDESLDFGGMGGMVMEILFKSDSSVPGELVEYWERNGFERNLVRDQYSGVFRNLVLRERPRKFHVVEAARLEDVERACGLFNSSFDELSGDYVPAEDFGLLLRDRRILMAVSEDGEFLGALHQTKDKAVSWISHVAVCPGHRGKGVGSALVDEFVIRNREDDKSRYMLWVQRQNTGAVDMYRKKGFVPTNKSTLSLVRK